jgi:hypothetical protein
MKWAFAPWACTNHGLCSAIKILTFDTHLWKKSLFSFHM